MNLNYLNMKTWLALLLFSVIGQSCYTQNNQKKPITMDSTHAKNPIYSHTATDKVVMKDEDWKKQLSPELYYIARQKGTERPFTSPLETLKDVGTFYCAVCGNPLFKSDAKFESGCGWPSFYEPISKSSIIYLPDNSLGMTRTEVECGRCKSHLGHVFDDGPPPTGLRYCINGVVLDFEKAKSAEKKYDAEGKH